MFWAESVNLCLISGQQASVRSPVWRISHLQENWCAGGRRRQTDSRVDAAFWQSKSTRDSDYVSISEASLESLHAKLVVPHALHYYSLCIFLLCYQLSNSCGFIEMFPISSPSHVIRGLSRLCPPLPRSILSA